jgi:nitrogen fixation protein
MVAQAEQAETTSLLVPTAILEPVVAVAPVDQGYLVLLQDGKKIVLPMVQVDQELPAT